MVAVVTPVLKIGLLHRAICMNVDLSGTLSGRTYAMGFSELSITRRSQLREVLGLRLTAHWALAAWLPPAGCQVSRRCAQSNEPQSVAVHWDLLQSHAYHGLK